MAKLFPIPVAPVPIWRANHSDDGYGEGAQPDWRDVDWASSSYTASAASGRTGSRTSRVRRRSAA